MLIRTEGIQGFRRKCFASGHTMYHEGEAKAQLQHRWAKVHVHRSLVQRECNGLH